MDALYANVRAFNRWMHEEVGFMAENRMFLPPYIALAEPELAVKELERVIQDGARIIQTRSRHAHGGRNNPFGGRSPADPLYDRFWSILHEADIRVAVHVGGTDYQKYGADWSEAPFPEENVQRVVAEVGIEPIVFGSDFPHGEGLAFPAQYVGAQFTSFSDADQRRIMRDSLENFLAPAVQ